MQLQKLPLAAMVAFMCYLFLASFFQASTWDDFPAYLSSGADIVMALTAITGVYLWKRQIKFNKKHDLADRVLDLSDELASALNYARNPFSTVGELEDRVKRIEGDADDHHKLVVARLIENDRARLELARLQKKIHRHFGEDAANAVRDLISMAYDLKDQFSKMSRIKQRLKNCSHTQTTIDKLNDEYEEISQQLTGIGDDFEQEIDRKLSKIDTLLSGYVN